MVNVRPLQASSSTLVDYLRSPTNHVCHPLNDKSALEMDAVAARTTKVELVWFAVSPGTYRLRGLVALSVSSGILGDFRTSLRSRAGPHTNLAEAPQ